MNHMEEFTMEELLAQQDEEFEKIKVGELITAKVKNISKDGVELDLDNGFYAIVPNEELNLDKGAQANEAFNIGDEMSVVIKKVSQKDCTIRLSKLDADKLTDLEEIKTAFDEHKIITVYVEKAIEKGVFALYNSYTLFIPISQLDTKFVTDTSGYQGKNLEVYVKEINTRRNRLVASHRDVLKERQDKEREERRSQIKAERQAAREHAKIVKEEILASLEVGQKKTGKVTKIMPYGAFIDIGGIEGLAHIRNLSWDRVESVEDVLAEGQEIDVYILDVDQETKKIALAVKDINNDPWTLVAKEVNVGDIIDVEVMRLIEKAAFVQVAKGVDAYLPISELSDERVAKMTNVVNIGDKIKVKVLEFKPKNKRMLVSIKEVNREPEEDITEYLETEDSLGSIGELFKDKFKDMEL
ncbi:MAG: S1 RNA-binding domain-containing protein [Clostridioides sp.]|nr:S1 RNA-binding domain-containing protein [Clostridioides sp.]